MLNFANQSTEINTPPGWDLTMGACRGSVLDMATQDNKEPVSGHTVVVPDAIVSSSFKYHISCMRPLCSTKAFLVDLGEHQLLNSHYFESSQQLDAGGDGARGVVQGSTGHNLSESASELSV